MKKTTKRLFIVFGASVAALAVTVAIILGTGLLASRDNSAVTALDEQIESITLDVDDTRVTLVASNERKIETSLNLWADEAILAADVALVTTGDGMLTITETPPSGKFLGIFPQPYELKITIYAPQGMIDDIDWR